MKHLFYLSAVLSLLFLTVVAVGALLPRSEAKGTESEIRQLPPFSSIYSNGSVDVVLIQGTSQQVKVVADKGLAERVRTVVDGDVLTVSNPGSFWNVKVMRVYVTVPNIQEIKMTGSGDLETEGVFKCNELAFHIQGSGDVELHLNTKNLHGTVTGSGDAEVDGVAGLMTLSLSGSGDVSCKNVRLSKLTLEVNGSGDVTIEGSAEKIVIGHYSSGDIQMSGLKAQVCDLEQRGSGDCSLYVVGDLNVSNGGSGDVFVFGNPKNRRGTSRGSGDIHFK